jgi:hypothetical protein
MSPRRVLTVTALVVCALAHAAPAPAKTIGIAEQKPEMFSDARFAQLGITHVRLNVAWDVLKSKRDAAALDDYMALADAHGASVLVTIDRSRAPTTRHKLPSVTDYRKQLSALHKRYPRVREFSAWNEANHSGQPTYRHPERAAAYWLALRKLCRGCTVLAADLLDEVNATSWARSFVKAAHHLRGPTPGVWGLHNYIDANLHRTTGTRRVLKSVSGKVWITETAGLVSRHSVSKIKLPEGVAHAANTTAFILGKLIKVSSRIQRAYLYMWNATAATTTWDSAFIGPDDVERPSLQVLRTYLGK